MKHYLPVLTLLFIALFSVNASAQGDTGTVSGVVKDDKGESLPFATVALVDANDKPITGAVSDTDGKFEMSAPYGEGMKLKISSIGYEEIISDSFDALRETKPTRTDKQN